MARAATSEEIEALRADKQYSRVFMAIHNPAVVYSARINQTDFNDPIVSITYDGGSGILANVIPGMTMYIGSSAGGSDKGRVRIRKAPTATIFYIGETSEILFANDLYLTVVDEFNLWQRNAVFESDVDNLDYDIPYSDENTLFNPIPILGPHAVLWLSGASVDFLPDASESYVLGSTISGYLWSVPGSSGGSDLNTATPTITYNSVGVKRVGCMVTAANGKTTTGYRYVFVYSSASMPVTQFQLKRLSGSKDGGGWEFSVNMFAEAGQDIKPNALVILFADDYYEGVKQSIGHLSGYEHIICEGRIDDESVKYDYETGQVEFGIYTAQNILDKMNGYATLFQEAETPAKWSELSGATIDKALFNLLYWRSTVIPNIDVFLSGDTRRMPEVELTIDTIWRQISTVAERRMLAGSCFDRYNRLFVEVDIQYLAEADRASIPAIFEVERDDWRGEINIEIGQPKYGMVEVNGIRDDTPENDLHSRAPGKAIGRLGSIESFSELVFDNQAHANVLSGMIFARDNNPYPWFDLRLASNNRLIDICPNQRLTISVSGTDTPRGIVLTNYKILPRRISYDLDEATNMLWTDLECEGETSGIPGITFYLPPPALIGTEEIEIPDFEDYTWPSYGSGEQYPGYIYPPITPGNGDCQIDAEANGPYPVPIYGELSTQKEYVKFGSIRCILRSSSHDNISRYLIEGRFQKLKVGSETIYEDTLDDGFYTIGAYNRYNVLVAGGIHDAVNPTSPNVRGGVFIPPAAAEIAYIKMEIADTELLRPTVVSLNFDSPVTEQGTLTWGLRGSGIWAQHLNTYREGSSIYTGENADIRSDIKIGATGEFTGKTIMVRHRMWYRTQATLQGGSGIYLNSASGGQWSGVLQPTYIGWGPQVLNFYNNGNTPLDTGWREWKKNIPNAPNNNASMFMLVDAHVWGQTSYYKAEIMEHLLYAWIASPYRIIINQFNLWNICPPAGL